MAKYIHLYENYSDFEEDYNGGAYLEPWTSYTEEESEPYAEVTAFTWSLDTYYGLDFTGEFKYVGDYYINAEDPETEEPIYDTTLISYYYPVWSNGKTYVVPRTNNYTLTRSIDEASHIESVHFANGHPDILAADFGSVNGNFSDKLEKEVVPSQVAYNKGDNLIYLTWDGTSMTKLREGMEYETSYPTYVVDQAKSRGDVKRAKVYINDEYAYTLNDFSNTKYVGSISHYDDGIVFGKDSNGNKTCTYTYSMILV